MKNGAQGARALVVGAFVVCGVWLVFNESRIVLLGNEPMGILSSRWAHEVVLLASSGLCLARAAARRAARDRAAWALIGLGMLAWSAGELYYTAALWSSSDPPIPSPGDAAYLLLAPLCLAGLIVLQRRCSGGALGVRWADGVTTALSIGALSAVLLFQPVLTADCGSPLAFATALAYPLLDMILLAAVFGSLARRGSHLDRVWTSLALGLLMNWVADTLYLVETAAGTYVEGSWFDTGSWPSRRSGAAPAPSSTPTPSPRWRMHSRTRGLRRRPVMGRMLPATTTAIRERAMPQADVDGLSINYEVEGDGEPLVLIPYLAADHACYAFQLPAYTEHFTCVSVDLPGSGESDKPPGPYSTESYADQVAAFLGVIGIESAHVAGVSLGAAVAMHLAARHPERVRSLSLHSAWDRTDAYLRTIVEMWRSLARGLPAVADAVIEGIFPLCFTPEMYDDRPEYAQSLADFVRSRPAQPLEAFLAQSDAVLAHDASAALGDISAPTLVTFGAHDIVTSTRFVAPLTDGIADSAVVVFDHLSHGGLHEDPDAFNGATLEFLLSRRA